MKDIKNIKIEYVNDYLRGLNLGKIGKKFKNKNSIVKVPRIYTMIYY